MMGLKEELQTDVDATLNKEWAIRDGQVVPTTEDVTLAGGAVKLTATMLYADLADSTELAMKFDRRIAAKVIKSFLSCSSNLIKAHNGDIRSFDGDRVMGVFVGNSKNTTAVKCALQINYAFTQIIKPKLIAKYPSLGNGTYKLAHCVGIDTSEMLVVRGGVRNHNDLVWIGRAPNIAAKLSAIRQSPYHTYITKAVFDVLNKDVKYGGQNNKLMWENRIWSTGPEEVKSIYRSSWRWPC